MYSVLDWEEEKRRCVKSLPWVPQLSEELARLSRTQMQLSSETLNRFALWNLGAGGSGGSMDSRSSSIAWNGLMKAEPSEATSEAQATTYNIRLGSCSGFRGLKKRASSSLCVQLLSAWSTALSWLRPPSWASDLCCHMLPDTQKGPRLGVLLCWCCLDRGPRICICAGPLISHS